MGRPSNATKYLNFWQEYLGLSAWDIQILRNPNLMQDYDRLAEVMWTSERETATIYMATDQQIKRDKESLEETILHELFHIRIHGTVPMGEFTKEYENTAKMDNLERTINALTKCAMKLKYERTK